MPIMKGKLFRRIQDGCIYEVIARASNRGEFRRWTVWNEKFRDRRIVLEVELARQAGWEPIEEPTKSMARYPAADLW